MGAAEGAGLGTEGLAASNPLLASSGIDDSLAGRVGMGAPGIGDTPYSHPDTVAGPSLENGDFSGPQSPKSPLDWDWKGAQDKASSFVKLAKQAQEFSSLMKGEPNPNQRLSQAAPQQQPGGPVSPQAAPSAAIGAANLPPDRLVPNMPMENPMDILQRIKMMKGY